MKKVFTSTFHFAELSKIQKNIFGNQATRYLLGVLVFVSSATFGQVSGTVFRDYNADGTKATNDVGFIFVCPTPNCGTATIIKN